MGLSAEQFERHMNVLHERAPPGAKLAFNSQPGDAALRWLRRATTGQIRPASRQKFPGRAKPAGQVGLGGLAAEENME